jgi:hypothetical protein
MKQSRSFRFFARVFMAGVLLSGAGISVAQTQASRSLSRDANQGDEAVASSVAVAYSEFAAAIHRWAQTKAPEVPWNENQSLSPISYQPVFLWAAGSGYAGSAANCRFPTASGAVVPGVSGPVKLSGQAFRINTSTSKQAQAIQSVLTNAGALTSDGSYQVLPKNFGSTWDGVFCASVKFNAPAANQAQIATWFAPARMMSAATNRASTTNAALVTEVGRKMADRAGATQPQVGVVLRSSTNVIVPR